MFEEGDLPKLLEVDVYGGMGVRGMVADYIENVKGGSISPSCDGNWSIVGNDWDEELRQRAIELIAQGSFTIYTSEGRYLPDVAVTVDDLKAAQS